MLKTENANGDTFLVASLQSPTNASALSDDDYLSTIFDLCHEYMVSYNSEDQEFVDWLVKEKVWREVEIPLTVLINE